MKAGVVALALLGASLSPISASASSLPNGAVCTQLEPNEGRSGISYFGGPRFCSLLAGTPGDWDYLLVPNPKPNGLKLLHLICGWDLTTDHIEYALAWSAYGYEDTTIALCDTMRERGTEVITFDPMYPAP